MNQRVDVTIIGSGGTIDEVPGFYADELDIPTVGGSFTLTNVPLVVLDITDPGDAGNIVDGIIGTNLFTDRNIVIDPNPSTGGGGASPSLYIGDPVTETHAWAATTSTADWQTPGSWSSAGIPSPLWVADVINVSGNDQQALVAADSAPQPNKRKRTITATTSNTRLPSLRSGSTTPCAHNKP